MDVQYKKEGGKEECRRDRRRGRDGGKEGGRERIHGDSMNSDLEGWVCKWLSLGVTTGI